jgi:hypothetical protein
MRTLMKSFLVLAALWSASSHAIGPPSDWKAGPVNNAELANAFYEFVTGETGPMGNALRATLDEMKRKGYFVRELQQPIFPPNGKVSRSISLERAEEGNFYVLKMKLFQGGGAPGDEMANYEIEAKVFSIVRKTPSSSVFIDYKLINSLARIPAIGGVTGGTR